MKHTYKKITGFGFMLFVLLALTGLFGPVYKIQAEDPKGTCAYTIITIVPPYTKLEVKTGLTETECNGWGIARTWKADPPAGICIVNNNKSTETHDRCTELGGTWNPATGGTQDNTPVTSSYKYLAPLGADETFDTAASNSFSTYLNLMIRIFIGICAVLAMLMIVMGGIEYMTSELISSKEAGKDRIVNAVFGLLLALGAYALLNTINPDLLKVAVDAIPEVTFEVIGGESSAPFIPISKNSLQALGINCPGTGGVSALPVIARSFIGKATYSMTARNTTDSTTAFVDCSSFVAQVYTCAGLPKPGDNTASIFTSSSGVITNTSFSGTKVNGTELQVGDLLGWKQGGNEQFGHVVMYIGNGNIIDAQRTGVSVRPLSSPLQARFKFIKRISNGGGGGGTTF